MRRMLLAGMVCLGLFSLGMVGTTQAGGGYLPPGSGFAPGGGYQPGPVRQRGPIYIRGCCRGHGGVYDCKPGGYMECEDTFIDYRPKCRCSRY